MCWRQDDIPKTAEARAAEIAALIRRRDRLLDHAPRSAIASQLVRGFILLLILMACAKGIIAHHGAVNAWAVYGLFGLVCLVVVIRFLRFPPLSDHWAMSRLVGYEGDSPQDLQNRIDRLSSAPDREP